MRFVGGRLSCTSAEVSIDLKDAESISAVPKPSVQPHEGLAPENMEDLVHQQECYTVSGVTNHPAPVLRVGNKLVPKRAGKRTFIIVVVCVESV